MDDEAERDDVGGVSIESLQAQNPHLLPHFQSTQLFNRFAQHILTVNRLGYCEVNARKIMPSELTEFQYPRWVNLVELGISMLQRGPGYVGLYPTMQSGCYSSPGARPLPTVPTGLLLTRSARREETT